MCNPVDTPRSNIGGSKLKMLRDSKKKDKKKDKKTKKTERIAHSMLHVCSTIVV